MDTISLVEQQIDEGRALLTRLKERNFPVDLACWMRPYEDERWTLCIATPAYEEKGPSAAYRELVDAMTPIGSDWVNSSRVTLVGMKNPATQKAIDRLKRYSGWAPPQFPGIALGGIVAEDIYVYPLGEVEVTLYGVAFPRYADNWVHFSFEAHNPHSTLTVGNHKYDAKTGIDWVVAAPDGTRIERDEHGRLELGWSLHGQRRHSDAHEVLALAKLGLHGFRIIRKPTG